MPQIDAIVFDIGGVLLRTDFPARRVALAQRYGLDRTGIDELVFGSAAARAAEVGQASEAELWRSVQERLNLSDDALEVFQREFWGGDQVDLSLLEWMAAQRPRRKVALLTNSWWQDPLGMLVGRFHVPAILAQAAVERVISSAVVGVRKPDPRIFQIALDGLGVDANRSIFVDDFIENVEAARALGWHGVHFRAADQARLALTSLLEG